MQVSDYPPPPKNRMKLSEDVKHSSENGVSLNKMGYGCTLTRFSCLGILRRALSIFGAKHAKTSKCKINVFHKKAKERWVVFASFALKK